MLPNRKTPLMPPTDQQPPILSGLSALPDMMGGNLDALILDIYGVLHDGIRPYPPTIRTLKALKSEGISTCLVSNTPLLCTGTAEQLADMGITPDLYNHIVTAGDSARLALESWQGKRLFLTEVRLSPSTGQLRYAELIEGLDVEVVSDIKQADVILNQVAGLSPVQERPLYAALDTALEMGLPMICANPDLVVMVGNTLCTCAGTYAEYYAAKGGQVSWHGKPHAPVYEAAYALLGRPNKASMAGVGDALRTDIAGALNFDITPVWNLDGIHRAEVLNNDGSGRIDADKLAKALDNAPHVPRFILDGFSW